MQAQPIHSAISPAQVLPDSSLGWHAMLRLDDSRVIARRAVDRRLISRTLFRFGMAVDLLAFRVADTHIHALVVCSRRDAGQFARSAASSLRQQLHLPVGFEAHFRAVRDQRHLYNAFRYVLRQEERHGVCLDPTHDGSSLPDLLGMRRFAPEILPRVRTLLPRLQSAELHDILGVDLRAEPDANDLAPAPDHPALELLPESATAAACAASFTERGAISNAAHVASVHIAQAAGLSNRQIRELLQLDARTVRRLGPLPRRRCHGARRSVADAASSGAAARRPARSRSGGPASLSATYVALIHAGRAAFAPPVAVSRGRRD